MKKHHFLPSFSFFLTFFFLFSILLSPRAMAVMPDAEDSPVSENLSSNTPDEITVSTSTEPLIQGLVTYDDISLISGYLYEDLPIYTGKTTPLTLDCSFSTLNSNGIDAINRLANTVATTQILLSLEEDNTYFSLWGDASLSEPISVYYTDGELYAYAYGLVDSNNHLIGYIVVGVTSDAPPVLEYSTDPSRYLDMSKCEKVLFDYNFGLLYYTDETIISSSGEEISPDILSSTSSTIQADESAAISSPFESQWEYYANLAEHFLSKDALLNMNVPTQNTTIENSSTLTATSSVEQAKLSYPTNDYTWMTLCTYTTMAMYFDAVGRQINPVYLGSLRPHSIKLNQTLHSTYGHSPTFSEIADYTYDYAVKKAASSTLSISKFFVTSKTSSNDTVWSKHRFSIAASLPTMVGYSHSDGAHIMLGIGYVTSGYYIVRDTWTWDGQPRNTTFFYNKDGYSFHVSGLTFTESSSDNMWAKNTLRSGDSGINVLRLKYMLNALYYSPGSLASSVFDDETVAAVKAFQADFGLTTDGVVGTATYNALKTAHMLKCDGYTTVWRTLSNGKKGDDVAQLQIRLYSLGYYDGALDGIFGSGTKAAVIAFQEDYNLTADGIAGSNTLSKLYSLNLPKQELIGCEVCLS